MTILSDARTHQIVGAKFVLAGRFGTNRTQYHAASGHVGGIAMSNTTGRFIAVAWLIFIAIWLAGALTTKRTLRVESTGSRLAHVLPIALAVYLLSAPSAARSWLNPSLYPNNVTADVVAIALTTLGLLYAIWARVHLGRNWSGLVTVKQDHELVTSGPYALTRHPIYTGLLSAILGAAIARGDLRGLVAFVLVAAALWRKLKLEERWMQETFGARYDAYKARVAALVPYLI
jgi:protein-S-isoprenylcysteine O-methyltransferase Ste14